MAHPATRTLDCPACTAPVTFELDSKWVKDRKVACGECGASVVDNADGERIANERLTLEEAQAIIQPYTRDQILDVAQRIWDHPETASVQDKDLVAAFVRCSAAKEKQN